ncbi:aminofutalosine synthase MqnE [Thermostilla marina]
MLLSSTRHDTRFDAIREKVVAGERLSVDDGIYLFSPEVDLHALGQLAEARCLERHGPIAYYNLNDHLNPSNLCVYNCRFCAYSRKAGDADAYELNFDQMLARAQSAVERGATELHIVGGIHPEKPFSWYLDILRTIHEAWPNLHLKAWTAVEIVWFARLTKKPYAWVLEQLIEAGLGSLPGGGAEIFAPHVRKQIAPGKADAQQWLEAHRAAHGLGLKSNATMLYGHLESPADRIDHMRRLRELQDETGGFQAFIPLSFHPKGTQLSRLEQSTSLDDLRVIAVSRLFLDNFPHIKAYWISLGVGTAQVALAYGANDLDGTVYHEQIHHEAGSEAPDALTVEQLRGLIEEAGRRPVERDSLYRRVVRDGTEWRIAESS